MIEPYTDVRFCREFKKGNFIIREYVAWEFGNPVDRFQIFRDIDSKNWIAWNCDTMSAATKYKRGSFVESLN
jgi:hypothetical protein